MPLLFSYGSLRSAAVQRRTFGRALRGTADALPGFDVHSRRVADARGTITTVLRSPRSGAAVDGVALEIGDVELDRADTYEAPDFYRRIAVTLVSGRRAWVYLELQASRSPVVFPGNPWPGGHVLRRAIGCTSRRGGRLRAAFASRTSAGDEPASESEAA